MERVFVYPVKIETCEEGGFFASCPIVPGAHAEGETYGGVIDNIRDVIQKHIELRLERGEFVSGLETPAKSLRIDLALPVSV